MSGVSDRPAAAPSEALEALEARIRGLTAAGDVDAATAAALEAYGPEILRFLLGTARDTVAADDAFAQFAVDVWRGLPAFQWQASLRTWCYVVARRALMRIFRTGQRHDRRHIQVPDVSVVAEMVQHVRTTTQLYLRTAVKDAMTELREQLDDSERTLLTLRVDRGLEWRDIAQVLSDDDLEGRELDRVAAQLRKQFQRLKDRLRALAIEAGIIAP